MIVFVKTAYGEYFDKYYPKSTPWESINREAMKKGWTLYGYREGKPC